MLDMLPEKVKPVTPSGKEQFFSNKVIMVTGAAGSIGRSLIRQISNHFDSHIIGIDNNESALFYVKEEQKKNAGLVEYYLGDLRDRETLRERFRGVDIVFHTAALKHVELSEQSPRDAIQTNILGTQNVIEAAVACNVEHVIFTSSDKAVNPTNVMGTSKLMCERLIAAASAHWQNAGIKLLSVRFGNVLGSNGSVIPLFHGQIARGGPVTVTHESMTRFIMSEADSVRFVIDAPSLAKGGEVFVRKMPAVRITDLASIMIEELAPRYGYRPGDIEVEFVMPRPGEKFHEELLSTEETRRALEDDNFIVILPAISSTIKNLDRPSYSPDFRPVSIPYNSGVVPPLDQHQLRQFLVQNGLIEPVATR